MAAKKTYERVGGAGVEIDLELRNRLLAQTFQHTYERTDNQLAVLSQWKGGGEVVKGVRELFQEQIAGLEKSIEQLKVLCDEKAIKVAFTGKAYQIKAVALTPHAVLYVSIFKKVDEALSYLHAMWVAGLVDDDAFREQAHMLRGRIHNTSNLVGVAFHKTVKGEETDVDAKGEVTEGAETEELESQEDAKAE
jgi:hypothetical protein